jgi:hypothetical protein
MTHPPVCSAGSELVDLVVTMRGWDYDEIWRVIGICQGNGWRFSQIALEMTRLAIISGTQPKQLTGTLLPRQRKRAPVADVHPATGKLVVLALQMRHDWEEAQLRRALAVCHRSGWPFAQAALELVQLATIPDSEPRDLEAAAASPFSRWTTASRRSARRG